jgi:hypothetical protein
VSRRRPAPSAPRSCSDDSTRPPRTRRSWSIWRWNQLPRGPRVRRPAPWDREIHLEEAAIAQRIFRAFVSPKAIGKTLNAEGIAGPTGWRGVRAQFTDTRVVAPAS